MGSERVRSEEVSRGQQASGAGELDSEGASSKRREKVLPAVHKSTTRSPVQLELARAVGHGSAVETKSLGSSIRGLKLDKAVASVAIVAD